MSLTTALLFSLIAFVLGVSRIKRCEITPSKCVDKDSEVTAEVFFYNAPKVVGNAEIRSNANSSITFSATPKISKAKNSVFFKFRPGIPGKYHMKLNNNLYCKEIITITNNFYLKSMPHTLFISDTKIQSNFTLQISFKFSTDVTYSNSREIYDSDVNAVHYMENINGTAENLSDSSFSYVSGCHTSESDPSRLICNAQFHEGFETGKKIKFLGFYYKNRCGQRVTLGFISVLRKTKEESEILLSNLNILHGYNMKYYQKSKTVFVCVIVDKEKETTIDYLYDNVAKVANDFDGFNITFADFNNDRFITKHFDIVDEGYNVLFVMDFSNDDTYIGKLTHKGDFEEKMKLLSVNRLDWTSQRLVTRILTKLKLNFNREEENRTYYLVSTFGFIVLLTIRCYLVEKQRQRKEKAQLEFNSKKKKEN